MTEKAVHWTLGIFIIVCTTVVVTGTAWLTNEIWLAMLRAAFGD